MNSKFLKTVAYIFSISVIIFIVLTMADSDLEVIGIIKGCCLGLCGLVALIYFYLFVYCLLDNKKVDALADSDQYEKLIAYINKRIKQKLYLVPERMRFYDYYLLLSYLMLENEEKCEEYFNKEHEINSFPVILYWKAGYELAHGQNENVESYYEEFKNSPLIHKYIDRYNNVLRCFESLMLYSKGMIKEAKDALERVDESRVHIPTAKKSIQLIKDSVVEEQNESVIEEQ